MTPPRVAPDDRVALEAWDEIVRLARDHCLVVGAAGGVLTVAVPEVQREHGLRDRILLAHGMMEEI